MKKEPEKKPGARGGARSNAGRPKRKGPVPYTAATTHLKNDVADAVKASADRAQITISAQIARILGEWAEAQNKNPWADAEQPNPTPDALSAAVIRLADVIEKIVNRNED